MGAITDKIIVAAWMRGERAEKIVESLNCSMADLAMRRWQIGLPDRDHKGKFQKICSHPLSWDGSQTKKVEWE